MNRNAALALSAAVAAAAATGATHAVIVLGDGDSVSLSSLLATGSDGKVIINDKLFTFKTWTSSVFNADDISVTGFISGNTNKYGLHNVGFDLTGPFGDGSPGDGGVHEGNLLYKVEVLPEAYARGVRLCDVRCTFNGSSGGTSSFARVDETVFDWDTNTWLGEPDVFDIFGPPREYQPTNEIDFCDLYGTDGYRAFEVNKDLKFYAHQDGDFATASFIRQEFSQIPAPGALALLGAAGLVGVRRRRG